MEETEIISGKKINSLFKRLQSENTVLSMRLLGRNYERLTIITRTLIRKKTPYFAVDYTRGFKEAVGKGEDWRLRFEFVGSDGLPYVFRTSGGRISKKEIEFTFPQSVERIQRRRAYRLEAPLGTRIQVLGNVIKYEFIVRNVSEGGALVSLEKNSKEKAVLNVGDQLKDLNLIFTAKEGPQKINIKGANLIRTEDDRTTGTYRYALKFTDIDINQKKVLRATIYKLQREFLRKRQFIQD